MFGVETQFKFQSFDPRNNPVRLVELAFSAFFFFFFNELGNKLKKDK